MTICTERKEYQGKPFVQSFFQASREYATNKENRYSSNRRTMLYQRKSEQRERIIPPVPVSTEWPLAIPTMKDSIHKYPIPSPFTGQTITNRQMAFVFSPSLMPPTRKKKSGKWKLMLAGSLGPQLAQNLYKLIATPHTDGISSDFPQQVSTWEEYYSYLYTRYQQGTLGKIPSDSCRLPRITAAGLLRTSNIMPPSSWDSLSARN